jgi:hypothetical protein
MSTVCLGRHTTRDCVRITGRHHMDAFLRRYIHENLNYRFVLILTDWQQHIRMKDDQAWWSRPMNGLLRLTILFRESHE